MFSIWFSSERVQIVQKMCNISVCLSTNPSATTHHHTAAATTTASASPCPTLRKHQRGYVTANWPLLHLSILLFTFSMHMCIFMCRHGGTDADAKCPDAPDHNAQHDAKSYTPYGPVSAWRAWSICSFKSIFWAGMNKQAHSLSNDSA